MKHHFLIFIIRWFWQVFFILSIADIFTRGIENNDQYQHHIRVETGNTLLCDRETVHLLYDIRNQKQNKLGEQLDMTNYISYSR